MIEADAGKAQEGEGQTGLPTDARAAGTHGFAKRSKATLEGRRELGPAHSGDGTSAVSLGVYVSAAGHVDLEHLEGRDLCTGRGDDTND